MDGWLVGLSATATVFAALAAGINVWIARKTYWNGRYELRLAESFYDDGGVHLEAVYPDLVSEPSFSFVLRNVGGVPVDIRSAVVRTWEVSAGPIEARADAHPVALTPLNKNHAQILRAAGEADKIIERPWTLAGFGSLEFVTEGRLAGPPTEIIVDLAGRGLHELRVGQ